MKDVSMGRQSRQSQPQMSDVLPAVAGVLAVLATFLLGMSEIGVGVKAALAVSTAFGFLAVCYYSAGKRRIVEVVRSEERYIRVPETEATQQADEITDRLIALDEANEVFGSALNAGDMFRLVASRVSELMPFSACILAIPNEAGDRLKVEQADGPIADRLLDLEINMGEGTAGQAFQSGKIEICNGASLDQACFGIERIKGIESTAAIPLLHSGKVFAVFEIFSTDTIPVNEDTVKLLEAIGEHITPIFRSSIAFERSLSNALTDMLTGLPNERAFYMVLENQLAESIRFREERPLAILTIDIKDFAAVNSMLGHGVGDRMLEFAGTRISHHLRKMDFLARTVNDEFSIILPTATEETVMDVIERIKSGFENEDFEVSEDENISIAINVGWAAFWKDGETADQLIRAAQTRKRQSKSEEPSGVLWFPKEYVN